MVRHERVASVPVIFTVWYAVVMFVIGAAVFAIGGVAVHAPTPATPRPEHPLTALDRETGYLTCDVEDAGRVALTCWDFGAYSPDTYEIRSSGAGTVSVGRSRFVNE